MVTTPPRGRCRTAMLLTRRRKAVGGCRGRSLPSLLLGRSNTIDSARTGRTRLTVGRRASTQSG
jgi:hypothetical protein